MFLPNNFGLLTRLTGTDKFGSPTYGLVGLTVPCGVVELKAKITKTAIRTDASASRGNADEVVAVAKVLFPSTVAIGEMDKFEIGGAFLRVMAVQPRYAVGGNLDHFEVDFEEWEA